MRLWYGDRDYSVAMTGDQPLSPAENMKSLNIWPPAVSDQLTVNIDLDMGDWTDKIDYLAIIGLNFDIRTTISIRGTSSSDYTGGLTDTISTLSGVRTYTRITEAGDTRITEAGDTRIAEVAVRNDHIVYEPTTWLLNYRYIRITITNTVDPVRVGRVMLGKSFDIVDKEPNAGDNLTENSVVETTYSGQVYGVDGYDFANYQIKLENTTAEDWREMRAIFKEKKRLNPFLISLFPGSIIDYPPVFVRYDQSELNGTLATTDGVRYTTAHSFVEVK